MNTGLISFCLYGEEPRYCAGLLANFREASCYYPGWRPRVYLPKGHFLSHQCRQIGGASSVVEMEEEVQGISPMFWRFLAAEEEGPVLFRDADSRFSWREVGAVQEWLVSAHKFHRMRDHPYHFGFEMLGGMWGVRGGIPNVRSLIENWKRENRYVEYGDDQRFLQEVVWPMARGDVMTHDEVGTHRPFPSGKDRDHVGGYARLQMNEAITGAYVLNPDRYVKRWMNFKKGLEPSKILSGFEYQRVSWPGPGDVWEPKVMPKDWVGPHFWRATLSHLRIFNEAWVKGHPAIIVLEDDVVPAEGCDELIQKAWDDLPKGWLALHLGSHQESPRPVVTPWLRRDTGTFDSWGYIWSREGIEAVLQAHFDDWFCHVTDVVAAHLQVSSGRMYAPQRWPLRQAEGPQFGAGE